MFINKHFIYIRCVCLKKYGHVMRNLMHIIFYVKTKISVEFHIDISVPLMDPFLRGKKYYHNA